MAIEYLDQQEDQTEMLHEHHCDECGATLIPLCSDDCDEGETELCANCQVALEGDVTEEDIKTEITELDKDTKLRDSGE
jgi:hypothetical protein